MSHNNSTQEKVNSSTGDLEGLPVVISEGCLDSFLSGTVDALSCFSTTPGPNKDPLPVLRGVTRNLSEIISDSVVADPLGAEASMFKTSDTTPIEELAGGACELPCTS